jgi:hypothetical protein
MAMEDFIIHLFCRVDDRMCTVPKHVQASLYPSEVVTLALLFVLKGGGQRAFYRWLVNNWQAMFPRLPDRTRLFRLFKTHRGWANHFLAQPTLLGVADTYGIEFIHPVREGRHPTPIGKKGKSNRRWIVGGKLAFVLNRWGYIVGWDCATANVHDSHFHPLIERFQEQMVVLSDFGFHARAGDPPNLKVCRPHTWNVRMLVETVLSMLTTVCHSKRMRHQVWAYFQARLAFLMALFNILVQWDAPDVDEEGFLHLSIVQFTL